MGAAAVLATAAETPPMRKSVMKAPKSLVLGGLDMMLLESVSDSYRERVERNFKPSNSESGGRDKQEIPARCCYYPELVADS